MNSQIRCHKGLYLLLRMLLGIGINLVDDILEVLGHHGTPQLQRVGQLALLHAERTGQEDEALHLLVVGKLLLKGLDAGLKQRQNLGMPQQVVHRSIGDALAVGVCLYVVIDRDNQGGNKLALVGNDGDLVDVAVDAQAGFQGLGGDILAVGGLEQFLDAARQIEMAVLQIARIAGVEPAVGGEGLGGGDGLLVVTIGDGLAPQQDFLIVGYLHLQAGDDAPHRAYRKACEGIEGHRGRRFRQPVSHHHVQPHGVGKDADFVGHGRPGRGKEVAVLQPDGLLQQGVDRAFVELVYFRRNIMGGTLPART